MGYPSWEELVKAEANGYTVTAVVTDSKKVWPWSIGPFETKKEAKNAAARLRHRLKKEQALMPVGRIKFKIYVRPLWKRADL